MKNSRSYTRWASALVAVLGLMSGCGKKSKTTAPVQQPCALSETSLDFGMTWVGQSVKRTLVLTNTGSGTLEGTLTTNRPEFAVVEAAASYQLAPGEWQAFTIQFAPTASGMSSADLATGSACGSVHLGGIGQVAAYGITDTLLAFGRSAPTVRMGLGIFNDGASPLHGTISSPCPAFKLIDDIHNLDEVSSITYTVPAGGSYSIAVVFRPTTAGAQSCVLQTGLPAFPRVACTGFGQFCGVAPTDVSFGSAWDWIDQQFTITNNDSFPLSGAVSENYPDLYVGPQTSYSLAPGASQTFNVQWLPQTPLTAGPKVYLIDTGLPTCTDVRCGANGDAVEQLYNGGCVGFTNGTACQGGGIVCFDFPTIHAGQTTSITLNLRNGCDGSHNPASVNLVELSDDLTCTPALFSGVGSGDSRSSLVTFAPTRPGVHHLRLRLYETTDGGVTFKSTGEVMFQATVLP